MPEADPRFKHRDIRPPSIPLERLDSWMASLMDPEATKMGWLAMIYMGLKVLLVLGYLVARKFLIDQQLEYEKQKYDQERSRDNQTDLDKESNGVDLKP